MPILATDEEAGASVLALGKAMRAISPEHNVDTKAILLVAREDISLHSIAK